MPLQNKILRDYRKMFCLLKEGRTFVAFDTETTGLSSHDCRIIEIGAVKFSRDGFIDSFNTLINPEISLPAEIISITHITDKMLEEQPKIKDILPSFCDFIKDSIIIGHNAQFDMRFLQAELQRAGMDENKNEVIDTLNFARWAFPDFPKFNQPFLADYFKIKIAAAHRAYDDAKVCGNIFLELIKATADRQKV